MRISRSFEGTVTALSPVVHGAGSSGIVTEIRRERIMQPDGTVEEVPMVSGNSIRGLMRRCGMLYMLETLGYGLPDEDGCVQGLSPRAFDLLMGGGSLEKGALRGVDIDFARKLREIVPLLSVFGGASGNQMLDGRLKMGFLKPICRETAHITHPAWLWQKIPGVREIARDVLGNDLDEQSFCAAWSALIDTPWSEDGHDALVASADERYELYQHIINAMPSAYELIGQEMTTRRDSKKDDRLLHLIESQSRRMLDDERRKAQEKEIMHGKQNIGQHQQMMMYTEVMIPGTAFSWEIHLDGTTQIEYEAFWSAMGEWAKFPHVGGKSGTGHGKIAVHFAKWRSIDPRANVSGEQLGSPVGSEYMRHLQQRGDEIREMLNGI